MLDAIAQTLAAQTVKPAIPASATTPPPALVASHAKATAVPVLKPVISPPEAVSPSFLSTSGSQRNVSQTATTRSTSNPNPVAATPTVPRSTFRSKSEQAVVTATSEATEPTTIAQRELLKQRLAEIVAKEKPLKEATLRANLAARAIAAATAGQFTQARHLAQDALLPPETQAQLLAQIGAIEAQQSVVKPTLVVQHPRSNAPSAPSKAWIPPTVTGRSLPADLTITPPPGLPYSYIPPTQPQYVSYTLTGFGRALGGIGVVVTDRENGNGSLAAGYPLRDRFAALWRGLTLIFPLAMPAPITSGFGWRVHPVTGDRRFHSGTDLGAPMGTPVLAAAAGQVALADWLNGYGLAIVLSHKNDTQETLYGHLSEIFVKPGQSVEKGAVIGRVGSTGISTGPHLHFELRQKTPDGWQAIDPGTQLEYALAQLVKS